MNAETYRNPPMVEAVFEVQFSVALSARDLERLRDRFTNRYPKIDQQNEVDLEIQADGSATTKARRCPIETPRRIKVRVLRGETGQVIFSSGGHGRQGPKQIGGGPLFFLARSDPLLSAGIDRSHNFISSEPNGLFCSNR
jgi:hypothetical protein